MNKQPFYHHVDGLMFTSTTGFGVESFKNAFRLFAASEQAKEYGIIPESIEFDGAEDECYQDPEPGDPADLL